MKLLDKLIATVKVQIWSAWILIPRRLKGQKNPFKQYIPESTIRNSITGKKDAP